MEQASPQVGSRLARSWTEEQAFIGTCLRGSTEDIKAGVDTYRDDVKLLDRALEVAIQHCRPEAVEALIDSGVCLPSIFPFPGNEATAIPMYEIMLKYGMDINQPLGYNGAYLMMSMVNEELVRWLLDHGAKMRGTITGKNNHGHHDGEYLTMSACFHSIAMFDLLLQHGAPRERSLPLHYAAGRSDGDRRPMMSHLIDLGFDVNADDNLHIGRATGTPLFYAVEAGFKDHVLFLLGHGADPTRQGKGGSAIELAENMGFPEIADACRNAAIMHIQNRNRHLHDHHCSDRPAHLQ